MLAVAGGRNRLVCSPSASPRWSPLNSTVSNVSSGGSCTIRASARRAALALPFFAALTAPHGCRMVAVTDDFNSPMTEHQLTDNLRSQLAAAVRYILTPTLTLVAASPRVWGIGPLLTSR